MDKWTRFRYQPVLPMGEDGKRITGCKEHIQLSRYAAGQGMVLLENENNILPLKRGTRVSLFGKATIDYVKGGGGSGDVTVAYVRNLADGMVEKESENKVQVFRPLIDFYRKQMELQYAEGILCGQTKEPEIPEQLLVQAASETDTAIVSLCRYSGEGWDRSDEDFYLTAEEKNMIDAVKEKFTDIIVVLNVGGIVDTSWYKTEPSIKGVLMAWQAGMEGAMAEADILCGDVNPSGKLTDTFASCFSDYPSSANFHDSDEYVEYTEDIYVGYRYFETVLNAGNKVNYGFGYGLSYTRFAIDCVSSVDIGDAVCFELKVTNTGAREGKEVVMIYASAPSGKLGKPAKELKAFKKTRSLKPGESQSLYLDVYKTQLASYDDVGKVQKSAWILEPGEYHFYYGNDVRKVRDTGYWFEVEETEVVSQLTERCIPYELKQRLTDTGEFESLPERSGNKPVKSFDEKRLPAYKPLQRQFSLGLMEWSVGYKKPERYQFDQVANGEISLESFVESLSDRELCDMLGGQPNTGVANTWGIGNIPEAAVPNVMTADGPAGLRIKPYCSVHTTAWPCATLLACSFDEELAEKIGQAGSSEVKENNLGVWLTPAINIHRNPLCGRNFEYYSEDPLVAGKMGAAMVRGIQSNHIAASVKHFACNNKEVNRKNSDSRVSERALREIYLKGFEIVVKEADPWTLMSSYNLVNGVRTSENYDLLTGILREEWGFRGMVTTDWWNYAEHVKEVLAGNDLKMAIGEPDLLEEALEKDTLKRQDLEKCAYRILDMILKLD